MDTNRLEAAAKELMNMPRYCESETLTLAKVKLKDGRDAIIRLELTTEEEAVEDAVIWEG
jgi:hypothetical protein